MNVQLDAPQPVTLTEQPVGLSPYLLVIERRLTPRQMVTLVKQLEERTSGHIFLQQQQPDPHTWLYTITVQLPDGVPALPLLDEVTQRMSEQPSWRAPHVAIQYRHGEHRQEAYGDLVHTCPCPACGAIALHHHQKKTITVGTSTCDDDGWEDVETIVLRGWFEQCWDEGCDYFESEPPDY